MKEVKNIYIHVELNTFYKFEGKLVLIEYMDNSYILYEERENKYNIIDLKISKIEVIDNEITRIYFKSKFRNFNLSFTKHINISSLYKSIKFLFPSHKLLFLFKDLLKQENLNNIINKI